MSYALITGATSGIGKQFANKFAQKGFDLFLVSRNNEKLNETKKELEELYKTDVKTLAIDLSIEDSSRKVHDFAKENNILVSILVNNAGYGDFGKFIDGDIDKYLNIIDLNDKALVSLTYYFVEDMKKANHGHIINVASIAGFMPGPYMAIYYASKAFVLNFSLAIKEELKKDNIHVTTLCPGPVDTNFWDRANAKMSDQKKKVFARSADEVATTGIKAFEGNKGLVVDGLLNNLAVIGLKLCPLGIASKLIYRIQKTMNEGVKHESNI